MDAATFNNNKRTKNTSINPNRRDNQNLNNLNSATSPRNYDSSTYYSQSYGQGPQQTMNNNQATTDNAAHHRSSSKDDKLRQDSISFYTNFGVAGPRFSTDSNSSITNFLNLPNANDQGLLYDNNGRGMSVINNLFLPPNSQGNATGQQQSQQSHQPQQPQQQNQHNYLPSGAEYNSYQIRRPSEQLEPFNPSIKLKNPNFSKKASTSSYNIGGNSFSDATGSEFDFFSKRDSLRPGRQSSFLNNSIGDSSEFDFFAKRDSIKNVNDDDLDFKDPNFASNTKRETKSEPDTPVKDDDTIPNRPQTAMEHRDAFALPEQQFRQPALPNFVDFEQQFPKTLQRQPTAPQSQVQQIAPLNTQPANQQQQQPTSNNQYQFSQPLPHTSQQQQNYQLQIQDSDLKSPSPTTIENGRKARKNAIQPMTAVKRAKRPRKAAIVALENQQEQQQQQEQPTPPPASSRYVSPPFQSAQASPDATTNSQFAQQGEQGQRLIPSQEPRTRDDGRPLLGATKVDQLMLVIQARKKGVHQQIPRADDGTILDNGSGILPKESELVGGIDKPKAKTDKAHECLYCHKSFTQSTHLEVHVRSHIGYKPFECSYCGKRFTQGGNLRTHMRLHTGEKPYICETCGRKFSRKGNLAAHELTHSNFKPFECKLDNCNKAFTQLGNLKAHQNRFHLETLNQLTKTLAETDPDDISVGPEQRELLNYFAHLYKNSNRGIKGRGRRPGESQDSDGQQTLSPVDQTVGTSSTSNQLVYPESDPNLNMNFDNGVDFDSELSNKSKISFKNVNYRD